ncbi:MAG: ATP synthase F1 subunit epsilon [Bacilli bacterium]
MTVPFEVVTPDRVVLAIDVEMVSLRGGGGDIGVLPRHTPLSTTVSPGIVKVKLPEGEDYVAVTSGFLQVVPDRITLLVETAEVGSLIDIDRALRARERAQKRISEYANEADIVRAEAALQRALNRLEAAELSGRYGDLIRQRMIQ